MQKALSDVPVTLRAEVASIDLEVSEILALVPGSIVKFGVPADDGVMLYAENVKLARAQPGLTWAASRRADLRARGHGLMSATDMTPRDALMRLGASTAEAIAQVLEMFAPGTIERGDVSVMGEGQSPFNGIAPGSVAASVSYVDGVTGANIFVLTAAGVRNMAQAMGMPAPEEGDSDELSELELSAVGEASNQMMSAAARAIGVVLGQEIEISVPDIRVLDNPDAAAEIYGSLAARHLDHVPHRRRVLPADPAGAAGVRRPHGPCPG